MGLFGPDAEKVLTRGSPASAVLEGLHITYTHDSETRRPVYHFRLAFLGGVVAGVRQQLAPVEPLRLGMPLVVRGLDDAVVIDWPATLANAGVPAAHTLDKWKMMKDPPAPGIVDEEQSAHAAAKKGSPAVLVVRSIAERSVMFGMGSAIDFDVVVQLPGDEPYAVQLKNVEVPCYAGHLPVAGVQLPCWVNDRRQDKVTIDWASAANRQPGVGAPAVQLRAPAQPVPAAAVGPIDVAAQISAADTGERIGGIDLDTFVAIEVALVRGRVAPAGYDAYAQQYGVAPGTWAATSAAWQAKIRSDWRLGAAYGERYEAQRKAR